MFGRNKRSNNADEVANHSDDAAGAASMDTEKTLTEGPSQAQIKRATRTRYIWTLFASFCLLVTVVFMILVELGQTDKNSKIIDEIYFINVNLTNIFPDSVPDSAIINSVAETLGLHDFYRVGLWNFCEGYNGQGTTDCSKHQTLYWFDPVKILLDELLSGASITLPTELTDDLGLIRIVSKWMFGLFLTGACLSFLMMFLQPIAIFSRWWALLIMIFTFLAALFTTVASVIATVLFIIIQEVCTSVTELNIGASIGIKMFVFMWIAAGASVIAFVIQLCLCCCCASRRDIKSGRKRGNKKAWNTETVGVREKPAGRFDRKTIFGRKN